MVPPFSRFENIVIHLIFPSFHALLTKLRSTLCARWRTVIDLMGSLQEEAGLVPTVSSYNVVVEALAKAGEWIKALDVLAEMKRNGVRPSEFTYSRCMAGW